MADKQAPPCRILVMASGFGSNFQSLIDAVADGRIPNSRIIRLISNRRKAHCITRAETAGIPWDYFNLISDGFMPKGEQDEARIAEARQRYDAALAEKVLALGDDRPELIVLAGWMYVFSAAFLEPMERAGIKIINLHPALPGAFEGANAIERAYEECRAGRLTHTGIMAHYVILEVDRGAPILVQEIEYKGESLEGLTERIHSYEHELIVKATAKVVGDILGARAE